MLVRMLGSVSKWNGTLTVNRKDGYFAGDTISDLRTQKNTLSTWEIADEKQEMEDVVVALSLNRMSAQKLVVVLLDSAELAKIEITHSSADKGKSPGCPDDILIRHRDLIDIDYWRLGFLAEHIMELMKDKKNYRIFKEKEVRAILEKYRQSDRLDIDKVNEDLKKDMGWGDTTD